MPPSPKQAMRDESDAISDRRVKSSIKEERKLTIYLAPKIVLSKAPPRVGDRPVSALLAWRCRRELACRGAVTTAPSAPPEKFNGHFR